MLERVRSRVHDLLRSSEGDGLAPVRVVKQVALRANEALGRPLAPQAELIERRTWEQGLSAAAAAPASGGSEEREQAPVVIFHLDKHHRQVRKMGDILTAAGVAYTVRNVDGDEPATEAALRDAGRFGLPFVMIGATVVGGAAQLADLDRAGELKGLVWIP